MVVGGMVVVVGVFVYFEILARCPASASGLQKSASIIHSLLTQQPTD
jgi:hypothetical protein